MDSKGSEWQVLINLSFGLISFFVGWILKVIFGLMSKMQEDYKDLNSKTQSDYDKISDNYTKLALSLPDKYVSKHDFDQLVKAVHHRFDKLEEKIDSLKESK